MRLRSVRHRVEDEGELVTAEASDGVCGPEAVDETLPDRHQQPVPGHMAERLVDDLEAIEVEEDDRDGAVAIDEMTRQRVRDPVGEQLAIGQTRRVVVQGAALRDIDEAGVLEPDRRQSGEARQRFLVPLGPVPRRAAGGEPEHPDHAAGRLEWCRDRGTQTDLRVGWAARPLIVVIDRDGLAGLADRTREALARAHVRALEVGEEARADAQLEPAAVSLDEVDPGVRRPEQRRCAGKDGPEEAVMVGPVEQREGGLVERAEIRVGEAGLGLPTIGGLHEIERAVGDGHELVLRAAVLRVARDASADRHGKAVESGLGGRALPDGPPDALRDLVGDDPIRARQERGELVAAVPIEPVTLAGGARHPGGDLDSSPSPAGWPLRR